MKRMNLRRRYFLAVSVLYIIIGVVIAARSAMAHAVPIALLGLVFVALGMVRLRDYFSAGGRLS